MHGKKRFYSHMKYNLKFGANTELYPEERKKPER